MSPTPPRPDPAVRVARPADIPEIVRITNLAYKVEAFCLRGDRTDAEDVRARMQGGRFLVIEDAAHPATLRGAVFMSISEGRGYLGTLAVDPSTQGQGLAKALIAAVEEGCRVAACRFLDISVVNLRVELFPFYAQQGFAPSGILPFPRPEKILRPLHLVQMTKPLHGAEESHPWAASKTP